MTDRELFEKTFSHLHASDRTLEEVYNVVQNEHSSHTKRYNARRAGRIILIAAALSLLLAVTAFAVYQHTVADLAMDDPQSAGVPYAVTWDGDTRQFYTVAGYDKQSPEYRAQAEWLYFTRFTEPGYDARQVLPAADPHHIYNAGHQVSADKLDELAEKYGLRLIKAEYSMTHPTEDTPGSTMEDVYALLGTEPFAPDDFAFVTGSVYDDGSFVLSGVLPVPGGSGAAMDIYCAMNGTMPIFDRITADTVDAFAYESIVTPAGLTADLALGARESLIFVTLRDAHVLVQVSGGTAPTHNGPMLTMDELKALAESYDFAAMETFDRQARQDAVARLCAEQLTASGRAGIDRGEEARIVYGELGDYAVTALPEGFVFSSSHVETFDSSGDTLWAAETGGSYVSVSVSYAGPEDRTIDLTYSRTWEDREKGIVNDRLGFDPEYILNDDSLELHPGAVNGHEAYYWTFSDAFSSVLFLHWLDTDEHIACRLAVPADLFTPADAIAMAESVQAR